MTETAFNINDRIIPVLAHLAGSSSSLISPWSQVEPVPEMTDAEWELLKAADLLSDEKVLKNEVREAIDLLREPRSYVRSRLINGPMVFEHFIYSCGPEQIRVGFSSSPEGVIVSNPAPVADFLAEVIEMWGDSMIKNSLLNLEAERESALVFAAIADLYRRAAFRAWADLKDFEGPFFTLDEIKESLANPTEDGQWLVFLFCAYADWSPDISMEDIEKTIGFLKTENIIQEKEPESKHYTLAGEALSFVNNFLIITQVFNLEVGVEESPNQISRSALLCLQAGIHDNVCLERSEGKLVLEAVPGDFAPRMLDYFLGQSFVQSFQDLKGIAVQEAVPTPSQAGIDSGEISQDEYYLSREGQNYGPYRFEELIAFKDQGNLRAEEMVWSELRQQWMRADSIAGLYG